MSDRIAGSILLIVSAIYTFSARGYAAEFGDPLGPGKFPLMIGVPAILLSAAILIFPGPSPHWARGRALLRQGTALVVFLSFAAFLEQIGFPLATFGMVAAVAALLGASARAALLAGAITGPTLFLLFNNVLDLPLPLAGSLWG